jgi:hypothetical protein
MKRILSLFCVVAQIAAGCSNTVESDNAPQQPGILTRDERARAITGEWVEESPTEVVPTGRTVTLRGVGRMAMVCSLRVYVPNTPISRGVADPARTNPRCRELFGPP